MSLGFRMTIHRLIKRFKPATEISTRKQLARNFERGDNPARVASLRTLAEMGDPEAYFHLGECYERGLGVIQNFVAAVKWYECAADRGGLSAMVRLGDIYLSGRVIRHGPSSVASDASFGSNRFRPQGLSVPPDYGRAFHWNSMAAEAGAAEAQARLGYQYANGLGVASNPAKAEEWLLAAAKGGCPSGQFTLGAFYAAGQLCSADKAKAALWFEKAVAQGSPAAKLCLGVLLLDGDGLSPEPARAAKLLTEAAEAGLTEAMFRLGQFYRAARGDGQNITRAETWLRRAGTRGHIPALMALAELLMKDLSTPDCASAAIVLREAADLGNPQAQHILASLHRPHRGVPLVSDEVPRRAAPPATP